MCAKKHGGGEVLGALEKFQQGLYHEQVDDVLPKMKSDILRGFRRGLDKAAELLISELEQASPRNLKTATNKYFKQWQLNSKYKNIRIVYNSKMVPFKNAEIPLANVLESKKPHIQETFNKLEDRLFDIIFDEVSFD